MSKGMGVREGELRGEVNGENRGWRVSSQIVPETRVAR